jgi:hypothetical protein
MADMRGGELVGVACVLPVSNGSGWELPHAHLVGVWTSWLGGASVDVGEHFFASPCLYLL